MAPITTIETITITRPLKVIAFICGCIVVLLMIMALSSTDWLMAQGWRQGLFVHCIEENVMLPIPFNLHDPPGCYPSRDVAYIKTTAALCIVTLATDVIATILTALGLKTQNHHLKYKFYRAAVLIMLLSLLAVLSALIIYPVCFAGELNLGKKGTFPTADDAAERGVKFVKDYNRVLIQDEDELQFMLQVVDSYRKKYP